MKHIKIDNHDIDYITINKNFTKGHKVAHVYYQYKNGHSQIDFIIDIDEPSETIKRIFTDRQLNILLEKLKREIAQ